MRVQPPESELYKELVARFDAFVLDHTKALLALDVAWWEGVEGEVEREWRAMQETSRGTEPFFLCTFLDRPVELAFEVADPSMQVRIVLSALISHMAQVSLSTHFFLPYTSLITKVCPTIV